MGKSNFIFMLFLVLVTALGIVSCAQEEDANVPVKKTQFSSDEEKIRMVSSLFESYGWEMETDLSPEEIREAILAIDYDDAKAFLEDIKDGWDFENSPEMEILETEELYDVSDTSLLLHHE